MTTPTPRDWGGLGAILSEARAIDEDVRQRDRVDCPRCGTVLDVRSDGAVNCPMGHYSAPRPPKAIE